MLPDKKQAEKDKETKSVPETKKQQVEPAKPPESKVSESKEESNAVEKRTVEDSSMPADTLRISEKEPGVDDKIEETVKSGTVNSRDIYIDDIDEENNNHIKNIRMGFFVPDDSGWKIDELKEKFASVIKKHKLKYNMEYVFSKKYTINDINNGCIADECRKSKAHIATILYPDFKKPVEKDNYDEAVENIKDEKDVFVEVIPWGKRDYSSVYLNLVLDFTLFG
jgi:hypothetical protein